MFTLNENKKRKKLCMSVCIYVVRMYMFIKTGSLTKYLVKVNKVHSKC